MNRSLRQNIFNTVIISNKAILMIIMLIIALSILSPYFFTSRNLLNVLRQVCVNAILACGFALVLGNGGIDLSIGATAGLTGIFMAQLMVASVPIGVAIFVGIVVGAIIGISNASIITLFKLPPFLVTMAMMSILRGTCYLVTRQQPVTGLPQSFTWIGQGYLFYIPFPIYIMLMVIITTWIIANRTKLGRYLLAMGGNLEAARVSGVNIVAVRYGVYVITGICGAIASVVMCARAASAQPTGGLNMGLDAVAAAVIGGTSMAGGTANIIGAFFGALIVGLVNNGLNLLGIDSSWQIVAKGALILIAVILDSVSTMVLSKVNTSG